MSRSAANPKSHGRPLPAWASVGAEKRPAMSKHGVTLVRRYPARRMVDPLAAGSNLLRVTRPLIVALGPLERLSRPLRSPIFSWTCGGKGACQARSASVTRLAVGHPIWGPVWCAAPPMPPSSGQSPAKPDAWPGPEPPVLSEHLANRSTEEPQGSCPRLSCQRKCTGSLFRILNRSAVGVLGAQPPVSARPS